MKTTTIPVLEQTAGNIVIYVFSGWSQTNVVDDTATWTHVNWVQNDVTTLKVSGYEDSGNIPGAEYDWSFITEDTVSPISSINLTAPYWKNISPVTISSTANDTNSGVAFVEFWYNYSVDNSTWGIWTKFANDTNGIDGWCESFNFLGGEGYYEFYSRSGDIAGNYEAAPGVCDVLCGYDATAPMSNASLISPSATNTTTISITYTKNDTLSGIKNVTLWYSYSSNGTIYDNWQRFNTESITPTFSDFSFDFPEGDGYYQFYSRATDNVSNWETAPVGNDTWVYRKLPDITPPTSSVDVISPYWHKTSPLPISATASDVDSGVINVTLWYRYSANNFIWGTNKSFGTDVASPWSWSFNFPSGEGYYEFYSIANDTANNKEAAPTIADAACAHDTTAPVITDSSPATGTTGDSYTFHAVAFDTISSISNLYVEYWFGSGSETNSTMFHTTANNYELGITIPPNSLDALHYRIVVVDMATNWNSITERDIAINDNDNPIANAGPDQSVDEGMTVTFNGSGSTDNIGVTNYTWTFTYNGTTRTLYGISHTFRFWTVANCTVTLNVTDAAGNWATDTMVVTTGEQADTTAPVASAGTDQQVSAGGIVTFDGSGSTDKAGIVNYTWTFTYNGTVQTLYGVSPTFRFWTGGNYTVTLTVRDAAGNQAVRTIMVSVAATAPSIGSEGGIGDYWWIIPIIVMVLILLGVIVFKMRGKKPEKPVDKVP
jgi:hypothetical protein